MNAIRISLVTAAALSALAVGSVRADDPTPDPYQGMISTRSRAEVTAECEAAARSGAIAALTGEDSGSMQPARLAPTSVLTRAQVRAEVIAARLDGSFGALNGEDSGSLQLDGPRPARDADANLMAGVRR
jgi:hypothetical protein